MSNLREVNAVSEVPTAEHWVIIVHASQSYDDGYGTCGAPSFSTLNYLRYIPAATEEEVCAWIMDNDAKEYGRRHNYRVLYVAPCTVQTTVSVSIKTSK